MSTWHLGSMNDGLFIIDRPASPSGADVPPGDHAGDPDMVLNVTGLSEERARAIIEAHNASLALPLPVQPAGAEARSCCLNHDAAYGACAHDNPWCIWPGSRRALPITGPRGS